jgi:hypothetical protein
MTRGTDSTNAFHGSGKSPARCRSSEGMTASR